MATEKQKAEFTEAMEGRLDEIRREFQGLELEQMRKGEVKARAKLASAKKSVAGKRKEFEDRLDTVRRASAAAWDDARDGLESAWDELRGAVDRARQDFEGTLEEEETEEKKAS